MRSRDTPPLLSFLCGFTSLSLEILWVRLYSFTQNSTPAAFGFVLMAYLFGIAIGAYAGSRQCRHTPDAAVLWRRSIWALWISAFLSLLLPAVFAYLHRQGINNPLLDLVLIACTACVLAYVFPIAHHLGANSNASKQGQHFARVYTANVAGAALGPLVTGYVLLHWLTLQQSFMLMVIVQCLSAAWFALQLREPLPRPQLYGVTGGLIAIISSSWMLLSPHALITQVAFQDRSPYRVIENRHGIITLYDGGGDDIVYGGNVYDGRTNVDVEHNTNGLHRPLLLAALHPQPERVLVLGLSIGSWLALVNSFPEVKRIDVLEINPGYVQAAQTYPAQANALKDPRVNLIAGDGRRWLRLHPERQYDLIIMNTTWHWRSNSSLLLSQEFFLQAQRHMAPGGILAFNATGSVDAFFTAASVFPHTYRYDNFVYASAQDFRPRKSALEANQAYASLKSVDGTPLFTANSPHIERYLKMPFVTTAQLQSNLPRAPEIVTDHNMLTEFRYGRTLYPNFP